ncbi:MAG: glycosyltransferase [Sphingomonas sp.]
MIENLIGDLDRVVALRGAKVILTFNIAERAEPNLAPTNLDIQYIRNEHPKGFASNHNAAFEHCTSDLFLVLNPDVRLPVSGFEALLEPFAQAPDVGLVAPMVESSDGLREDSLRTNLTPLSVATRRFASADQRYLAGLRATQAGRFFWVAGMFMLFRANAFAAVGGFDSRLHLYCEDYDICARLWLGGWRIRPVDAYAIVHDAQRATGRSMRHLRWHVASLLRTWLSLPFWTVSLRSLGAARATPAARSPTGR